MDKQLVFSGRRHSEETRKKMRESALRVGTGKSNKGRKFTQEHRDKIGLAHKGKFVSEITREKLRLCNLGKKASESVRLKMSLNSGSRGINNPNWKNGISLQKGYQSFLSRKREFQKRCNGGSHSMTEWLDLKKQYNYMCLCCKRFEPEVEITEDHIIPIKLGGNNNISNIQPLCRSCNARKRATFKDYRPVDNVKL